MMKIKIKAFGITKDIIGDRETEINIDGDKILLSTLRKSLYVAYPDLVNLKSLAFAINEEYAEDQDRIENGSTVVLIPPVSGG